MTIRWRHHRRKDPHCIVLNSITSTSANVAFRRACSVCTTRRYSSKQRRGNSSTWAAVFDFADIRPILTLWYRERIHTYVFSLHIYIRSGQGFELYHLFRTDVSFSQNTPGASMAFVEMTRGLVMIDGRAALNPEEMVHSDLQKQLF